MRITNIEWDTEDNGEILTPEELNLPCEVEIPNSINPEDIADWLSDTYGFCVICFEV